MRSIAEERFWRALELMGGRLVTARGRRMAEWAGLHGLRRIVDRKEAGREGQHAPLAACGVATGAPRG